MNSFQPLRFFFWLKKFVAIDSESRQIDSYLFAPFGRSLYKKDTKRDFKLEKIKGPGAPYSRTNFFISTYTLLDLEIGSHLNRFQNYKNFQRNQPLYLQRLCINYDVEFIYVEDFFRKNKNIRYTVWI